MQATLRTFAQPGYANVMYHDLWGDRRAQVCFAVTVIVSTIWGGKVSIVVDRRISRRLSGHSVAVVDDDSNKLLVVQCHGSLFAVAYTGIAVAHQRWMDCVIADCLAHQKLSPALVQPGSSLLARPAYALIRELMINLNGALNTDKR